MPLSLNQDAGAPGEVWGGSSPGRYCGVGVYGASSVCRWGPGPLFALQPCYPDRPQNRANMVVFLQGTNGS